MRRFLFTSALFVALGCGEASRPGVELAEEHAGSPGVSSRYAPGQQDTYRVSWSSRSVAQGPAFLPQDTPIDGGLTLEGTLVAYWYATDGAPRVGLSLTDVDSASVTLMGANIVGPLEELVGVEVIASLDEDGAVRSVHIPRDASPLARTMLGSLVARFDFRAPSGDSAVAVVPSTHGTAEASYVRDGTSVRRALQRSVRFDADVDGDAPSIAGEANLELDASGALQSLSASDTVVVANLDGPVLESETRLDLQRIASTRVDAVHAPDLEAWDVLDPLAPADTVDSARTLARNFADGLTGFDISVAVRSAGHGLPPEPGFMVRAVGRLRGWPDSADELIEVFDSSDALRAQRLVFDILASAGTPQAQRVMRELQAREDVRANPDFPNLVQRWAFVERPTSESATFLMELHSDAFDSDDDGTRAALLYPMGSMSRQIEVLDPMASAALLETIRGDIEPEARRDRVTAAIAGLGNAGRSSDLSTLLAFTTSDDTQFRVSAAEALRFLDEPEAEHRLLEMLGDDSRLVAQQALAALGSIDRPNVPTRLASAALEDEINPEIASSVASQIITAELDEELTRSAVQTLASASVDPRQRAVMASWLDEIADAR